MSADRFDAYHTWLGIPPAEQPPNHYRLLGLRLFEDQHEVISSAADRQMAYVRSKQTGHRKGDVEALLNALSRASVCLLDSEKKRAYDQTLRPQAAEKKPAASVLRRRKPKSISWDLVKIVVGGLVGTCIALVVLMAMYGDGSAETPSSETPSSDANEKLVADRGVDLGPPDTSAAPDTRPAAGSVNKFKSVELRPDDGQASNSTPTEPLDNDPGNANGDQPKPAANDTTKFPRGNSDPPPPATSQPDDEPTVGVKAEAAPSATGAKPEPDAPPNPAATEPARGEKPKRTPVPSDADQSSALAELKGIYQDEFAAAKDAEKKSALAKTLLAQAGQLAGGSAEKFVMLRQSYYFAVEAVAVDVVGESSLAMSKEFDVDGFHLQSHALKNMAGSVQSKETAEQFTKLAIALIQSQIRIAWHDQLPELTSLVESLAIRLGDIPLRAKARILASQAARLKELVHNGQPINVEALRPQGAGAKLAANDCRAYGRYQCLVEGNWPEGLKTLSQSDDEALQEIAELDLRGAKSDEDVQRLIDKWAVVANSEPANEGFGVRAFFWICQSSTESQAAKLMTDQVGALVDRVYKEEIGKAKQPAQRGLLAQMLLEHADELNCGDTWQFLLTHRAYEESLLAGDYASFQAAADRLSGRFAMDTLALRSQGVREFVRKAQSRDEKLRLAQTALALVEHAMHKKLFNDAQRLAGIAASLTARLGDPAIQSAIQEQQDLIKVAQREWTTDQAQQRVLADAPDDPNANHVCGRYLCLIEGDWPRGLPMLIKGNEPKFKSAATRDLAEPTTADDQEAAADAWYEIASLAKTDVGFMARARHWYELALAQSTGLGKVRIAKRLESMENAGTAPSGLARNRELLKLAYALDQQYGFELKDGFPDNSWKLQEKWVWSRKEDRWYFITQDGVLRRATDKTGIDKNPVTGKLDNSFFTDTSRLHSPIAP